MTRSMRVWEFDVWRPGYGDNIVSIYLPGTTTLAAVYADPALTTALPNPQPLVSKTEDDISYGKWAQPIYIGTSYYLSVDDGEQTGTERLPLFDLSGADASAATVTPTGGTAARSLADLTGAVIDIKNYGALSASPSSNTALISAAIGQAAASGSSVVRLPAGVIEFTTFSVPQGVVLQGAGRGITTLRSTQAQKVVTLAGDRAGLRDLTLDGVTLNSGSYGVYAVGRTEPVLDNVEVKRFDFGIQMKGATRPLFRDLYVSNCTVGADLRGDTDAGNTGLGSTFRTLFWHGGKVDLCSTAGVILSFENAICEGVAIRGVDFSTNSGTALRLNGARAVLLQGGRFSGNTVNIGIADDSDTSQVVNNTVRSFQAHQAMFSGGQITFDGTCDDVAFDNCNFADVDFVLSIPTKPVLLIDCFEDAATTATGATEKLQRSSRAQAGTFAGVTTDGNYITAWSLTPDPGEVLHLRVRAIGRQRNGVNYTVREVTGNAQRDAATLGFDLASGTLVVANIVTGATSGASARIVANSQTGAAGTLSLRDILGTFEVGETLSTSGGLTAKCVAPINSPTTTVGGVTTIGTAVETDSAWDVTIDASTPLVRARVRGATSQTVEWTVFIDVLRP